MRTIEFDYPIRQIIYKDVGRRRLSLYSLAAANQPTKNGSRPAILFFNGGSFTKGPLSATQFQHQARYFASKGFAAYCVDYRNGCDEGFTPMQAICDVKSAVRYVRRQATELGVNPNQIAVCGASAGGYIAVSSIMLDGLDDDEDRVTDHIPNHLIIFAAGMDGVDIIGRLFPALLDVAKPLSPLHHIKKGLPPTLWMCGTADLLYEQNKAYIEAMEAAGNDIAFVTYEGMEHGFFNYGNHDNHPFEETKLQMESFLKPFFT